MALRVKCKCGKSLKISSKFADKKISCPGCKRPFKIPAAKFKAAAAKAKAKRQAASEPSAPAAAPALTPADLDLQPANLDFELSGDIGYSQSDILGDIETEPMRVTALPHACPSCNAPLAADAVLCVSCGYNLRTGANVEGLPAGVPALPNAAPMPVRTASYATESNKAPGQKMHMDAIEGPKRSFWRDLFRSFIFPFASGPNAIHMVCLCVCYSVAGFICFLDILMDLWMAAVYLNVVSSTAAGSDDFESPSMTGGFVDSLVIPFFSFIGAFAVCFLPAIVCLSLMEAQVIAPNGVLLWAWFIGGALLWPMVILMAALHSWSALLKIHLVVATIFQGFLPYLCIWLSLVMAMGLHMASSEAQDFLVGMGLQSVNPFTALFGILGGVIAGRVFYVYLMIVAMRLIGLFYLHYKHKFTFRLE